MPSLAACKLGQIQPSTTQDSVPISEHAQVFSHKGPQNLIVDRQSRENCKGNMAIVQKTTSVNSKLRQLEQEVPSANKNALKLSHKPLFAVAKSFTAGPQQNCPTPTWTGGMLT